jgi:hypothetical protein
MSKTNLKSDWDSSGNLVFTANASGSGSMVFNTATPVVLGTVAYPLKAVTNIASASNYTMSVTQLMSGFIRDTCNAAISVTLPTVAQAIAVIPGWQAGTSFTLTYQNPGNSTVTLYTDGSTQWTVLGTNTIAANNTRTYDFIILSNVTGTVVSHGVQVM